MLKMFPSKSMVDYMSELNRLFPRPSDNDLYSTQYPSPQSGTNQSSSSAESTSPESCPELLFSPERNRKPSGMELIDTPRSVDVMADQFMERRQRPIVGRKILHTPETSTPTYVKPQTYGQYESSAIWSTEDPSSHQITPPNVNRFYIENNYRQNVFYELFPNEYRGFEFPQFLTPIKQDIPTSPISASFIVPTINVSPNMKVSPTYSESPNRFPPSYANLARNGPATFGSRGQMNRSNGGGAGGPSRFQSPDLKQKMCTFCRKNGETPVVYMTHSLKEKVGNKQVVSCPILRSHVCSTCGSTGDDAHTITYCPIMRSGNNGLPLQSTTITLKNTRIKSNGRRRF